MAFHLSESKKLKTDPLPTGQGGAYEKVDTRTAKPIPAPAMPASKSEMLFLDYLNEWIQIHKASIQTATFISYNQMIQGRITQYFKPLGLKLCELTPQVLDDFQEKILLEGYTTNTVIHYHAIFGKAFRHKNESSAWREKGFVFCKDADEDPYSM